MRGTASPDQRSATASDGSIEVRVTLVAFRDQGLPNHAGAYEPFAIRADPPNACGTIIHTSLASARRGSTPAKGPPLQKGVRPMPAFTVSRLLVLIALVLFLLAAFHVSLGAVDLIALGLAVYMGSHLVP